MSKQKNQEDSPPKVKVGGDTQAVLAALRESFFSRWQPKERAVLAYLIST